MLSRGDSKDIWLPRFLREAGVRKALTALYVGLIGSTENARLLLENDVDSINLESARGNPITIYCFKFSIRWFKYLKEFSLDPNIFSRTFLEPARTAARFIIETREEAPFSMSLKGAIFLKSPPFYNKAFGESMCTIAIMVPELNSVLSMRCPKVQVNNVTNGNYCIHGIQPVPFVNRAHPTRLEIEPLNHLAIDPFNASFCWLSFKDIDKIDQNIAFENFVELYSEQVYDINKPQQGRRLGLLAVLGGKIYSVGSGPYITIQDPCNYQTRRKFFVSQNVLKSLNMDLLELEKLIGKQAKFMVIFWYRYGSMKFTPPYPEIINIKFVTEESTLIKEDIVGYVRIRGKSDLKTLRGEYKISDLSFLQSPLILKGDEVLYDFSVAGTNRIGKLFLEHTKRIKQIRAIIFQTDIRKESGPFIFPAQVLNTERLELKGMAEWIFTNKPLFHCLLALLMKRDLNGELPSSFKKFIVAFPKFADKLSAESFLWLKNLDLINVRKNKPIQVTERGITIAYLTIGGLLTSQLKKIVSKEGCVEFIGLEEKIPAPPSLLLKALRRLEEQKMITCGTVNRSKTELFWVPYCGEAEGRIYDVVQERIKLLQNQVIAVLKSFHAPLHPLAVLERIRIKGSKVNYPALIMLLSNLASQNRIRKNESGFWFYPLETQVIDVFKENPFETFTVKELAIKISLAPTDYHLTDLENILTKLKSEGLIQEIADGHWSIPLPNNTIQRKQIILQICRKKLLSLLEKSNMYNEILLHELISFIASIRANIHINETSPQIAQEVIDSMLEKGEIIRERNFLKLSHYKNNSFKKSALS